MEDGARLTLSAAAAPGFVLVAVLLYGFIHSVLASLKIKAATTRLFGDLSHRFYRLFYNIFAVVSFLPVLVLAAALPDRSLYSIPFPWWLLTSLLQGAALMVLLVSVFQTGLLSFLGIRQLTQPVGEASSHLVVNGLYRWIRHPIYTAGLIFIWSVPRMSMNLLALNAGLSLYFWLGALFEERKLVHEFGESYLTYRKATPMLIPWKRPAS